MNKISEIQSLIWAEQDLYRGLTNQDLVGYEIPAMSLYGVGK